METKTPIIKTPFPVPVRYEPNDIAVLDGHGDDLAFVMCGKRSPAQADPIGGYIALCINEYPRLLADNEALRLQVEKYEEALRHYADKENWTHSAADPRRIMRHYGDGSVNGYDLARAVLPAD